MSDIFRINDANDIKLTGGVQKHAICSVVDTRDTNTITCLEAGAQNCGGNDPGGGTTGITSVYVSGCLSGSGTEADPIYIVLDPTGGIACGADGLYVSNVVVVTGVTDTQVYTTGCLSGSGTLATPLRILLNPTGNIYCTSSGLAVQFPVATGLNNVSAQGCLSGNGTAGSPLTVLLNSTGNIYCTSSGLAVQFPEVNASVAGCLSGNGSPGSPLAITLNPTGGIQCTAGGLAINAALAGSGISSVTTLGCLSGAGTGGSPLTVLLNPTGNVYCTGSGLAVQFPEVNASVAGCLQGNGSPGSPLAITLNPTGGIQCTAGGLAINAALAGSGISSVTTLGCLSGAGTVGSPLTVLLSPTGNVRCTPSGLSVQFPEVNASVAGCLEGNGSPGSPLAITLNPTGGIHCTPAGLAVNLALTASSGTGGCTAWSYESGNAPGSPTQPTTPTTNLNSGTVQVEVFDDMLRFWFYDGSFILDKEFSGGGGSDYFVGETDEGNSGASITIDFTSKANHKLTLTASCALSFTAPASARETKIRFVQGGSGGYTITLPSGTLGSTPILSSGVGDQTVVNFYYDADGDWHV